jgi:O-antigen/teichoic acid export membrane protein
MKASKAMLRSAIGGFRAVSLSQTFQQAGWLAVAKIVQGLASILAMFVIARSLGPTVFGELSLAIAMASFVAAAATLGLEQIATRELTLDEQPGNHDIFPVLQRMRVIGALVGSFVLLALAYIPAMSAFGISGLLIVLCLLPLAQAGDLWEWRLITAGHSKRVAIIAVVLSPTTALVRVGLALAGTEVSVFAWILIAEWAARSILLSVASRSFGAKSRGKAPPLLLNAIPLLRDSMPLLLSGIAVFIYMRIDQFMIASMLGTRQVGLYSAVVMLAEAPLVLPTLLLRAALPELTKQSATNPAQYYCTLRSLMRNAFYLHALIAILLCVFANAIITLLYGESFHEASMALRLQILGTPFVALGVLSSAWLVLQRCTGHALRRTAIGAIVNVVLNLLLIPHYGIAGAATATLISQIIATYAADAFYTQTHALFLMKTQALLPQFRGYP